MKQNKKALIVDDALFMRTLIQEAISDEFDEILCSSSYSEFLDEFRMHEPDLVTIDLSLDAETPLQGVSLIKDVHDSSPETKIIVISALNQNWLKRKVFENGASSFLAKPFDARELRQIARTLMEARDANTR